MKIYCARNLSNLDRYAGKDCWVLVFDTHNYEWLFVKILDPDELRTYYQNSRLSYDVRNIDYLIENGYICLKIIHIYRIFQSHSYKNNVMKMLAENDFYEWSAMQNDHLKLLEPCEIYSTAELLEDLDGIVQYIFDRYKNYTHK